MTTRKRPLINQPPLDNRTRSSTRFYGSLIISQSLATPPHSPVRVLSSVSTLQSIVSRLKSSPPTSNDEFELEHEKPDTHSIQTHEDLLPKLQEILPPDYSYVFTSLSVSKGQVTNKLVCFTVLLTSPNTKTEAAQRIQDVQGHTCTIIYRITRGKQRKGK